MLLAWSAFSIFSLSFFHVEAEGRHGIFLDYVGRLAGDQSRMTHFPPKWQPPTQSVEVSGHVAVKRQGKSAALATRILLSVLALTIISFSFFAKSQGRRSGQNNTAIDGWPNQSSEVSVQSDFLLLSSGQLFFPVGFR